MPHQLAGGDGALKDGEAIKTVSAVNDLRWEPRGRRFSHRKRVSAQRCCGARVPCVSDNNPVFKEFTNINRYVEKNMFETGSNTLQKIKIKHGFKCIELGISKEYKLVQTILNKLLM